MAGGTRSQDDINRAQQEVQERQAQLESIRKEVQAKENLLTQQIITTRENAASQLEELRLEMRQLIGDLKQSITGQASSSQSDQSNQYQHAQPISTQDRQQPCQQEITQQPGILGTPPQQTTKSDIATTQVIPLQPRLLNLVCPRFSDGDPTNWLYDLSNYFEYNTIPEHEYLIYAALHLDQPASRWYQATLKDHPALTFDMFKEAILQRFGPSAFTNPDGALAKLYQKTTVLEYKREFEELLTQVPGLSPRYITNLFISGLKPEIQGQVLIHQPKELHLAFSMARMFEDQLQTASRLPQITQKNTLWTNPKPPWPTPQRNFALPQNSVPPQATKSTQIKRLTPIELQRRRDSGLCYNCDEKYTPGHKCKGRGMLCYFQGQDDEEELLEEISTEDNEDPSHSNVSFHALTGHSPEHFIRLTTYINQQPLEVLVDSGS